MVNDIRPGKLEVVFFIQYFKFKIGYICRVIKLRFYATKFACERL